MKEKPYVVFTINDGGKEESYNVDLEQLRTIVKNASIKDETLNLNLSFNGEILPLKFKKSQLLELIKKTDLKKQIVPKSISNYLVDLTRLLSQKQSTPIKGRDDEIEKVWFYISQKRRNNVFLVGGTDVGKTAIAMEIARQISTNECPKEFYDTRVMMLRPELILKIKNEFALKIVMNKIMEFLVKNKNKVILYMDKAIYMKMDEYFVMMFYAFITKYNIPIITTSSEEVFEEHFFQENIFSKYVNEVYIEEPELEELQPMLQSKIVALQKEYGIKISDEMIKFGIFTSSLSESVSLNPGNVLNIFGKSFLEAKRKGKDYVDKKSVLSCYNSYLKLYSKITLEDKKIIAYHETGHYVAQIMSEHMEDVKIAFVSILPMMDFLGVNSTYRILGKNLNYTKEYMIDWIAVFLAGRVAEKQITDKFSTGASSDLKMANMLAEQMVMKYGLLSDAKDQNRCYVTGENISKSYLISEKKKQELDSEVKKILEEAYKKAEKIIAENKYLLDSIVNWLVDEEILTGEQLEIICQICNEEKQGQIAENKEKE